MELEFIALDVDNEVHYWLYYADDVPNMLCIQYIMSNRTHIAGCRDHKLGVL